MKVNPRVKIKLKLHMSKNLEPINWQPMLQNELVCLQPLQPGDFDSLYTVASDPLIWEQHPNKNRYRKEIFESFFEGAILSNGAFLITEQSSKEIVGSSRFCEWDMTTKTVQIGYTFLARKFWGRGYNQAIKKLMLDYAFQFADKVHFHVGCENWRSRTAMERLGGKLVGEIIVAYYGDTPKNNVIFEINKLDHIKDV